MVYPYIIISVGNINQKYSSIGGSTYGKSGKKEQGKEFLSA